MNIGILGGGQLGRMMALAGIPLGLNFRFLDPDPDAPAQSAGEHIAAPYDAPAALETFLDGLDAVTYEFENVPDAAAHALARHAAVFPPPQALAAAQDRLREKELFTDLGIPVPPWAPVDSAESLATAVAEVGTPSLLKTRRFGYDGKGQAAITSPGEAEAAWESLGRAPAVLERRIEFRAEYSILAVRSRRGETAFYPLIENHHENGILRVSRAPAPSAPFALSGYAEEYAARILERLKYVGVLALELFDAGSALLANEFAPRVHNSGHWTIEGADCSQFENHLRAILGWPLGSTRPRGHSTMVNLIGTPPADIRALLALPGVHLHLYGKAPRPGRKIGHVTATTPDPLQTAELTQAVRDIIAAG